MARVFFAAFLVATLGAVNAAGQRRVVDLTAPDSLTLKATIFTASAPGPGVLLLHQCNRQRAVWDGLGQRLASAGFHVLALDLRGFGESGGERSDRLSPEARARAQALWPQDIDVAFRYLVSQPGVTRDAIGVAGASCGVNNAVQTARRHPEVKSLVLLSGQTDLEGRTFLRSGRKVPSFFALADDDEFPVSVLTTQWLYSLTSTPEKKLVRYPNGGHGADMFAPHPELMDAIVEWFRATLAAGAGRAPVAAATSRLDSEAAAIALLDSPGGAARVTRQLAEARQRDPAATLFPEALVNIIGYEHLQSGAVAQAIEIFALNVSAFPGSPNAYDSLSDAYLAGGQKDLARANAQKALELLPSATGVTDEFRNAIRQSAEQKLKALGGPQR